jgi:hypothetical protein
MESILLVRFWISGSTRFSRQPLTQTCNDASQAIFCKWRHNSETNKCSTELSAPVFAARAAPAIQASWLVCCSVARVALCTDCQTTKRQGTLWRRDDRSYVSFLGGTVCQFGATYQRFRRELKAASRSGTMGKLISGRCWGPGCDVRAQTNYKLFCHGRATGACRPRANAFWMCFRVWFPVFILRVLKYFRSSLWVVFGR